MRLPAFPIFHPQHVINGAWDHVLWVKDRKCGQTHALVRSPDTQNGIRDSNTPENEIENKRQLWEAPPPPQNGPLPSFTFAHVPALSPRAS